MPETYGDYIAVLTAGLRKTSDVEAPDAPAAPTITAMSDGNGTSATITVDGDAGVTNRLYYRRVGTWTWTTGLTRGGDGPSQQTGLTAGNYVFLCVSDDSGVYGLPSNVAIVNVAASTAHPMELLFTAIRQALADNATTGLLKYVPYLLDDAWIPPETPFPLYGLSDEGSELDHVGAETEVMLVGITAVQEIETDELKGHGLVNLAVASPNIRQKGVLQLHAELRAVFDEVVLPGFGQGRLESEAKAEYAPIDAEVGLDGRIERVKRAAIRKKAIYRWVRMG